MANDNIAIKGRLRDLFQALTTGGPVIGELRAALHEFREETVDMQPEEAQNALPDLLASFDAVLAHAEKVTSASMVDALTGLHNRGAFDEKIQELVAKGDLFSLVVVDIDHFKKFNDTHGHIFGDQTLRVVGRMMTHVRDGFAARYGGEEMAILIEGADAGMAHKLADRVRLEVQRRTIIEKHAQNADTVAAKPKTAKATVSMGVSQYISGDTVESLFSRADEGLYQAKREGRNRVVTKMPDTAPLPAPAVL